MMLCWLANATLLANDAVLPADIKDNLGRTPVDLAREGKHNEVAAYITNYKPLARGELGCPKLIVCLGSTDRPNFLDSPLKLLIWK